MKSTNEESSKSHQNRISLFLWNLYSDSVDLSTYMLCWEFDMKCREVAFKGNREIASLKDREQTITPCYFFLYCVCIWRRQEMNKQFYIICNNKCLYKLLNAIIQWYADMLYTSAFKQTHNTVYCIFYLMDQSLWVSSGKTCLVVLMHKAHDKLYLMQDAVYLMPPCNN